LRPLIAICFVWNDIVYGSTCTCCDCDDEMWFECVVRVLSMQV
jgi:hypothetical protein